MRRACCLVPFLFLVACVLGQEPTYTNFTTQNGLPSNHIYHMIVDRHGFLWIATDAGVSRYDGREFQNFFKRDGLGDNEILLLAEDKWDRIWFLPFNGRLSYYRNGKVYGDHNDPRLARITNYSPYIVNYTDSLGRLWFGTSQNGIASIDSVIFQHAPCPKQFTTKGVSAFVEKRRGFVEIYITEPGYRTPALGPLNSTFKGQYTTCPEINGIRNFSGKSNSRGLQRWLSCNNSLTLMSEDSIIQTVDWDHDPSINRIDWLAKDSLWVNSANNGTVLFVYSNGNWTESLQMLDGRSITATIANGSKILHSSSDNGLFCLNAISKHSFGKETDATVKNAQHISTHNGKSIIAEKEKLHLFDEDGVLEKTIQLPKPSQDNTYKIHNNSGKGWIVSSKLSAYYISNDSATQIAHFLSFDTKAIKDAIKTGDYFWLSTNKGLIKTNSSDFDQVKEFEHSKFPGLRTTKILEAAENLILVGTNMGLFCIMDGRTISLSNLDPGLNSSISHLSIHNGKYLVVGTIGNGVILISKGGKTINLHSGNGLIDDNINCAYSEDGSTLWIGSHKGLSIIKFSKETKNIGQITNVGIRDGLPFERIESIGKIGKTIVIGNGKALEGITISNNISHAPPTTIISHFSLNGTIYPTDSIPLIPPGQTNIRINFNGISLTNGKNVVWKYRMREDDQWIQTSTPSLELASLAPGDYRFEVKSSFLGSQEESESALLHFTVLAPFHQTWPFFAILSLLILLLIAGIFYWISRARLNRANLNRKITESRLTALRTQMNPHFIFNSLNSIQNFITNNEKDAAYLYLARFGKLMRRVLDNSDQNLIPLEDEIDTLELYCQLEQLRSNNGFDFSFEVADDIDEEFTLVPPTLIQPIIENAIWHGVIQASHRGKITVSFTRQGEMLVCRVRDNGIGREKAMQLKAAHKRHKSRAISITQERLNLLNDTQQTHISMQVVDHKDTNGNPLGTEVILTIPDFED